MMRRSVAVTVLLCSLAAASVQAAEVYKYTDKSGKSHFSDTPQPGWNKVNVTPVPPTGTEMNPEQAQRAAECAKRSEELAGYKSAAAITEKNGLGVVHEYTEDEKRQLIEATEKDVNKLCAGLPAAG
jgi:hypothetical protein